MKSRHGSKLEQHLINIVGSNSPLLYNTPIYTPIYSPINTPTIYIIPINIYKNILSRLHQIKFGALSSSFNNLNYVPKLYNMRAPRG